MGLQEYQRKRHFQRTPEPAGKQPARKGRSLKGHSFVVQKHDASHLHYDFRLELDGVLKSWAVPKGPSLDPQVKRLAVEVEDHPIEYGSFEGTIPEGEYGGGTVMLWDRGRWEPVGDPREGLRRGRLKFALAGEKLRGAWMLVRTGGTKPSSKPQWLLFKERDDEAREAGDEDILEELPLSVKTSRSLDEIATDQKPAKKGAKSPQRKAAPAKKKPGAKKKAASKGATEPIEISTRAAPKASRLPARIDVQLATLVDDVPPGSEWLHEIKFDGYRMVCRIDHGAVQFITRNHNDWTARLPGLAEEAAKLPVSDAILDGEVVAVRPDGSTDFQELQNAFRQGRAKRLKYYAFDLLHMNGQDLRFLPLISRKELLEELLSELPRSSSMRYSEHFDSDGPLFFKQVCSMKLEGIISKRRDLPYQGGRGANWLKVKCVLEEEFVIGGYTEPTGTRIGFGALLIGYHDSDGNLRYAGKVGTGFDTQLLKDLYSRLKPLEQKTCPFEPRPRESLGKVHWVDPKLVAQLSFGSWTNEGRLRHPSFKGLREDKPAQEVVREEPLSLDAIEETAPTPPARNKAAKTLAPTIVARRTRPEPSGKEAAAMKDYDARREEFDGVRLTSPDKVLYPEQKITKLELANYYREVAEWILPHIRQRPLVLVRCPEGRDEECFYQKHPVKGTPDLLRQIRIREKDKTEPYVVVDDVPGLITLAQIGALEIHAWGSREDKLEKPDRLIFDLDPGEGVSWSRIVDCAHQMREFLQELGLKSFVKTTGGKGLHLVLPITRLHDWAEAKQFCKEVAEAIAAADPKTYTVNMSKAQRPGRIFLDYLRNGRGATAVVPFSTRAREGAPVSVPLTWKELTPKITSNHFNIRNLPERLAKLRSDPWKEMEKVKQGLAQPWKKLKKLMIST